MNRAITIAAVAAAFAWGAAAQEKEAAETMQKLEVMLRDAKVLGTQSLVMGPAVKNAPYSGEEISETTQMLADGNRIHRESRTKVYRDSEGRVRRETPESVTIWDPVGNVSYVLSVKDQTARQIDVQRVVKNEFRVIYQRKIEGTGEPSGMATIRLGSPSGSAARMEKAAAAESLGQRNIEGVNAEGTRQVTTIETGAIGNDRPIQVTSERWYSNDLQTVVLTRRNDPRTGEEVFRLVNINRSEPPADLFQVPAGYQVLHSK